MTFPVVAYHNILDIVFLMKLKELKLVPAHFRDMLGTRFCELLILTETKDSPPCHIIEIGLRLRHKHQYYIASTIHFNNCFHLSPPFRGRDNAMGLGAARVVIENHRAYSRKRWQIRAMVLTMRVNTLVWDCSLGFSDSRITMGLMALPEARSDAVCIARVILTFRRTAAPGDRKGCHFLIRQNHTSVVPKGKECTEVTAYSFYICGP